MTGDDRNQIPGDWDALVDRSPAARSPAAVTTGPDRHGPPVLTLMASAWADLVGMLAVCTGAPNFSARAAFTRMAVVRSVASVTKMAERYWRDRSELVG